MTIKCSRGESTDGNPNSAPIITTIRMSSQLNVGGTFSAITTMPVPCADIISKRIERLVNTVEWHIPESQKEAYREAVDNRFTEAKKNNLTLSDIISLISLIISFCFQLADSFPDEQMQKIIDQNDIIISQKQEELRLNQERNAMLQIIADSIENISDLIDVNPQGVDVTHETFNVACDSFDGTNNGADLESEPDAADSQQDDGDT